MALNSETGGESAGSETAQAGACAREVPGGLVLSFGPDRVRLLRRSDAKPLDELGAAPVAEPGFEAAMRALGRIAHGLAPGAPVAITLPAEHAILMPLPAGADAESALERALGARKAQMMWALGPVEAEALAQDPSAEAGRPSSACRMVAAADVDTVREARAYAETWGFQPLVVSASAEDGAPSGPALWTAPSVAGRLSDEARTPPLRAIVPGASGGASRSVGNLACAAPRREPRRAIRTASRVAALGLLVGAVAAFAGLAPKPGFDGGRQPPEAALSLGDALRDAPQAPPSLATLVPTAFQGGAPEMSGSLDPATSAAPMPSPETSPVLASPFLASPVLASPGAADPSAALPAVAARLETTAPPSLVMVRGIEPHQALSLDWALPAHGQEQGAPVVLAEAPLRAPPPSLRPAPFREGGSISEPAEPPSPLQVARPGADTATPDAAAASPGPVAAACVPDAQSPRRPHPPSSAAADTPDASTAASADGAAAGAPPAGGEDAPEAASSAAPPDEGDAAKVAAAARPGAAPEAQVGPVPRPRPDLAEEARAAIARVIASEVARKPVRRPPVAARPPVLATASGDRPRPSSPRSVTALATVRNGLPAEGPNLIGVFGAREGRRAIIRDGDGALRRVATGDRVDGWIVGAITNESVRLRSGTQTNTLRLPSN